VSSATNLIVAALDRPSSKCAAGRAENRTEQARTAGCDRIAEQAACRTADDQPRGAVITAAVVAPVLTAIDPLLAGQAALSIAVVVTVVTASVVATVGGIRAIIVVGRIAAVGAIAAAIGAAAGESGGSGNEAEDKPRIRLTPIRVDADLTLIKGRSLRGVPLRAHTAEPVNIGLAHR